MNILIILWTNFRMKVLNIVEWTLNTKGNRMKRGLLCLVVLFVVIGQSFLFADRNAVNDFLNSYEAVVVEAETLAKKATINAMEMMPLSQKAMEFSQRSQTIQTDTSWTVQDTMKLLDLTNRYTEATDAITKKL